MQTAYLRKGHLVYMCKGCDHLHMIPVDKETSKQTVIWGYNNNLVSPTLTPSINVGPGYCHHFLRDGKIQFLSDCKHELKGQTVPLEPFILQWED